MGKRNTLTEKEIAKKMETLGGRICLARIKAGLTQSDLGNELNCSDQTICDYENDKRTEKITFSQIVKLCDVLNVDFDYLTGKTIHKTEDDSKIIYSTKELETVCTYTGLSEKTAKTLKFYSGMEHTQDIAKFLSDLIDNHIEFLMFLESLEDYLSNEFIKEICSQASKDESDPSYSKAYYQVASESSDLNLFQCQRILGSIDVKNDEYIKAITLEEHSGVFSNVLYRKVNPDLPPTPPI